MPHPPVALTIIVGVGKCKTKKCSARNKREQESGVLIGGFPEKKENRRVMNETPLLSGSHDLLSLYRDLVETSQDLVWQCDVEGRCTYLNPAWETTIGHPVGELLGRKFTDFQSPEIAVRDADEFARLLEGGPLTGYETVFTGRSGGKIFLVFNAKNYHDENGIVLGTRGTAHDITKHRRAEQALKESIEKFRTMFQHAPLGIAVAESLTRRIIEVNEKFAEITGRTREELLRLDWKQITHPDDVQVGLDQMALLNAGTITEFTLEKRYIRPDGSIVLIRMTSVSIPVEDNDNPRYMCLIQDITEVRQIEARLRHSEKMEAIGQLAGGISHDFNNVLGGIIGYTDMSLGLVGNNSVLENNLRKVLKASDRAKNLVQQILAFSQQGNPQKTVTFIQPIIKEVLRLFRASIPSSVIIEADLSTDTKPVLADPTKIHEVLVNLTTNAVHAMDSKGTLTFRLTPVTLHRVEYGQGGEIAPGEYTVIEVTDTGRGMDAVTLSKAFEPFFTTKSVGEGTGLGLSVVLGVVRSHGGDLQIESVAGKGTKFRIFLPVTAEGDASCADTERTAPRGGTERILYVDDETMLVDMINEWLTNLGYTVIAMTDSVAALKFMKEEGGDIDMLITDQTMPNMTGVELAKEALKIRKNLPIILCTGFSSEVNPERAAALGITKFLMKPFRSQVISILIREVLDNKKKELTYGINTRNR
jgi:two-component system, cell cycle sensor histidine kinase and response regulator CckA